MHPRLTLEPSQIRRSRKPKPIRGLHDHVTGLRRHQTDDLHPTMPTQHAYAVKIPNAMTSSRHERATGKSSSESTRRVPASCREPGESRSTPGCSCGRHRTTAVTVEASLQRSRSGVHDTVE